MRNERNENIALIADDDQFIRDVVRQGLDGFCDCIEVSDGMRLVEVYKDSMPDILFLDVHLPNVNGLDLIPQIKKLDQDAFIIMLTSDSTAENVKNAVHAGAHGFIGKPFNKKTLLKNLHRCPSIKLGYGDDNHHRHPHDDGENGAECNGD